MWGNWEEGNDEKPAGGEGGAWGRGCVVVIDSFFILFSKWDIL